MNYEQAKEKALKQHFGSNALGILLACSKGPTNPYRYFGRQYRRSWSYGYFNRLRASGLIRRVDTPAGCRGTEWYVLA